MNIFFEVAGWDCKEDIEKCGECEKEIIEGEPTAVHDGETCHINCAAKAQDEDGFDSWFDGK